MKILAPEFSSPQRSVVEQLSASLLPLPVRADSRSVTRAAPSTRGRAQDQISISNRGAGMVRERVCRIGWRVEGEGEEGLAMVWERREFPLV